MSYMRLSFYSNALQCNTDVSVIYPTVKGRGTDKRNGIPYRYCKGVTYQTLWLFHGGGGDYSDWVRNTAIERYAEEAELIVVCPSAHNSAYVDMILGQDYFTYLTEELPAYIRFLFPIAEGRENNFLAGLSMGGYGAYKWAMQHPETFACVGCFASPVDIVSETKAHHMDDLFMEVCYGSLDRLVDTKENPLYLMKKHLEEGVSLPKMYMACGYEDFNYEFSCKTRDTIRAMGIDLTWDECHATHNFEFWDDQIEKFIHWLPLLRKPILTGREVFVESKKTVEGWTYNADAIPGMSEED